MAGTGDENSGVIGVGIPGWVIKAGFGVALSTIIGVGVTGIVQGIRMSSAVEQMQEQLRKAEDSRANESKAQAAQLQTLNTQVGQLLNLNSVVIEITKINSEQSALITDLRIWRAEADEKIKRLLQSVK